MSINTSTPNTPSARAKARADNAPIHYEIPWPAYKDEIQDYDLAEDDNDFSLYLVTDTAPRSKLLTAVYGRRSIAVFSSCTGDGLYRSYRTGASEGAMEQDGYWLCISDKEFRKKPGDRTWFLIHYGSGKGVHVGGEFETLTELEEVLHEYNRKKYEVHLATTLEICLGRYEAESKDKAIHLSGHSEAFRRASNVCAQCEANIGSVTAQQRTAYEVDPEDY